GSRCRDRPGVRGGVPARRQRPGVAVGSTASTANADLPPSSRPLIGPAGTMARTCFQGVRRMRTVARFAAAFAAGAALMYYLDPVAGRRRRALARDRGVSAGHEAEHLVRSRSRHAIDRAQGMMARARAGLSNSPVEDGQLYGRIRTRLGRMVAHPGEVSVEVEGGHVVLRG